jgi:hypothetical protein
MPASPLFADDNSSYRRAQRREAQVEKEREQRREQILATLRRLRDSAVDPAAIADQERKRRHQDLLERYPPLY